MANEEARKIVALDIDDVQFPFVPKFLDFHNARYDTHLCLDDVTDYFGFDRILACGQQERTTRINEFWSSVDFRDHFPFDGVSDGLAELKRGYDLINVTAKQHRHRGLTHNLIKHHLPGLTMYTAFCNHFADKDFMPKDEVCLRLGVWCMVDDCAEYVKGCVERGIRGIIFGNYPWNRAVAGTENIPRAYSWQDLPAVIRSLEAGS